jgi:hypothetical protein
MITAGVDMFFVVGGMSVDSEYVSFFIITSPAET